MREKCICFAYFVEGKFIGWYADTFGSVRPYPKIYGYSPRQVEIVTNNFRHKIEKVNETTQEAVAEEALANCKAAESKQEVNKAAILGLTSIATQDSGSKLRGKEVELRIVECPIYDGPNPNFDEVAYNEAADKHREGLQEFLKGHGVSWDEGPSTLRSSLVTLYEKEHGFPKRDSWTHADSAKVKEWAANEPTEFIEVIKSSL